MGTKFYLLVVMVVAALINSVATLGVIRDAGLTTAQRRYQIVLIWCAPIVGALMTYLFRRLTSEPQTHHNVYDAPSNAQAIDFGIAEHGDHSSMDN